MKTYGRVDVQVHVLLTVEINCVSGQLHAPPPLPPGKGSPVPIWQEAGWALDPFWTQWRRKGTCPCQESRKKKKRKKDRNIDSEHNSRINNFCRILTMVCWYWTNCTFGLYPSSGVSKIEELSVQWLGHLLPPVSDLLQGFMCVCTQVSGSVVSKWPLCEFCGRVYCDIWYICFLIPQFFETPDDG
jgi:hypothetical protein